MTNVNMLQSGIYNLQSRVKIHHYCPPTKHFVKWSVFQLFSIFLSIFINGLQTVWNWLLKLNAVIVSQFRFSVCNTSWFLCFFVCVYRPCSDPQILCSQHPKNVICHHSYPLISSTPWSLSVQTSSLVLIPKFSSKTALTKKNPQPNSTYLHVQKTPTHPVDGGGVFIIFSVSLVAPSPTHFHKSQPSFFHLLCSKEAQTGLSNRLPVHHFQQGVNQGGQLYCVVLCRQIYKNTASPWTYAV